MRDTPAKKESSKSLRLLIETGDGRSASAILENSFLRHCLERGAEVHVLSPGACYQPFVEAYRLPGVTFSYLSVQQAKALRRRRLIRFENRLGCRLARHGLRRPRQWLWKSLGARLNAANAAFLNNLLNEFKPDCVITAHLNQGFGGSMISLCYLKGIPTLGNVFSWDHPFNTHRSRPDRLTCWSRVMRDNLVKIGGYMPEQIEVIGAPIFDTYIDPAGVWSRQELCDRLGLDPARPILVFATIGQMRMFWDETGTFRAFLEALDRADIPGPPQIVLRFHPVSVDHYFDEFRARKDIVFSRYSRYCPGMRWWPSREEYFLAGNLLRHADVCISPGSTMTIETAIFDTPTIVPAFNPIMPDEYEQFLREATLNKHFRFLVDENALCIVNSPEELIAAVSRALAEPTWLAEGRQKIRDHVLGPLDGRATERLAISAVDFARKNATHKKKIIRRV